MAYKKKIGQQINLVDLGHAAEQIRHGKSQRQVERESGIPRGILRRFMKNGSEAIGAGRPTALGKDVEEKLMKCILARATMGFPCTRKELLNLVQEYVSCNNIPTPFTSGKPGKDWYGGFMRRHPELSLKKPESLQKARVKARDPFVVFKFYDDLKAVYEECLSSACLIYNADESAFGMDPTSVRGLGRRGELLHMVTGGSGREFTTVLACVSASGQTLPPLIVYTGKAVQPRWVAENPYPGIKYAANDKGWMTEATFFMWMRDMFIPHVNETRGKNGLESKPAMPATSA